MNTYMSNHRHIRNCVNRTIATIRSAKSHIREMQTVPKSTDENHPSVIDSYSVACMMCRSALAASSEGTEVSCTLDTHADRVLAYKRFAKLERIALNVMEEAKSIFYAKAVDRADQPS